MTKHRNSALGPRLTLEQMERHVQNAHTLRSEAIGLFVGRLLSRGRTRAGRAPGGARVIARKPLACGRQVRCPA